MSVEFSIPQLVAAAFNDYNYNPLLASAVNRLLRTRTKDDYNIALREATEALVGYEIPEVNAFKDYGPGDADRLSGVPIFQPLVIGFDNQSIQLDSAVVNISREKNIVVTNVAGRDGSIKEFINNGDFSISVSGLVSNNNWIYPIEKVSNLHQYLQRKSSLNVTHEILNAIGIYEIVITDYALEKTPYINCQPYSFNALSDDPVPLIAEDQPSILSA